MADLSGIGDLVISVGGDISPLEQALNNIPEAAAGMTTALDDAFAGLGVTLTSIETATAGVASDLQMLAAAAGEAMGPVEALGEQMSLFAELPLTELPAVNEQLQLFVTYAGNASEAALNMGAATQTAMQGYMGMGAAAQQADEANQSFLGNLAASVGALYLVKTAITDMVDAYGNLQRAQLALGSILGNQQAALAAIDSAKQLADALGVAQDSAIAAQQKLAALGISLESMPTMLTAIADGAAAMNTNFDTAAQRFDMIVNSGTLMARSLLTIGLNVESVAQAMGMAGVPATVLTQTFKGLDEAQRAAVLSSAELTKNAGDAAAAASGVAGTWNTVKNALESAWQSMGKAADGFTGLAAAAKVLIEVVETGFLAVMGVINQVTNLGIAMAQTLIASFTGIGEVLSDVFTSNFARIPEDVKNATDKINTAATQFLGLAQKEFSDSATAIGGAWGAGMQTVGASTTAAASTAGQAINALSAIAQKAQTDFNAVAAAFAAGKVSAAQYEAALKALNTAQENANGGLQNAHTALLMVQDDYRKASVAVANAATDLAATVQAVDTGTASWSQYVKALDALNKAQEDANGGLQVFGTALSLVDADLEKLAINAANTETYFKAVVQDMANGDANAVEYTNALNAMNKAQEELNGGLQNAHTALLIAQNDYQQMQVTLANATTYLQAVMQAYDNNTASLNQLIDATDKYVKAQMDANNGVLSQAAAMAEITAAQSKANLEFANSNTLLAQARSLYEEGSISLGTYETYLKKAQQAADTLNGTHKTAVTTVQTLTAAHQGLSAAVNGSAQAFTQANGPVSTFATSLQMINGQWVQLGGAFPAAAEGVSTFATSLALVNGQLVQVGSAFPSATAGATQFGAALQVVNGQLVNLAANGTAATNAINQIGSAATSAAGQVQSLSSMLDQSMNAPIGGLNMSLTPGEQITMPTSAGWVGGPAGGTSETITWDPLQAAKNLYQATQAGQLNPITGKPWDTSTTATTAATAVSAAATKIASTLTDAIDAAQAANMLEEQANAAVGTAAYAQLKTVADAAVLAAGKQLDAALNVTAATNTLATATTAAASSTTLLATTASAASSTLAVAAQGVTSLSTAVAKTVAALGPGQGAIGTLGTPSTTVPTIGGPNQGIGSLSAEQLTPWLYGLVPNTPNQPIMHISVDLSGSTIVGQAASQNLADTMANAMVSKLQSMGVRITRQ